MEHKTEKGERAVLRDEVLALLKQGEGPLSGEAMSRRLGVSRAAVWKAVENLRQEGYVISSATNRGYRLEESTDLLSAGELSGALDGCLVGRELLCLPTVDSTNSEVKRQALAGKAEGLAVLADEQTGGRGRRGREFESPAGKGLYCSVLLRPECTLDELMWLTAWTAVAVCDAVEEVCGVRPGIKWTNDLVLEGRKLCGILTELGMEGESARLQYAAVGIGINVSQQAEDFGPVAAPVAISLAQALGKAPRRTDLAAALLRALDRMYREFPTQRDSWYERYRKDCLTLGKHVQVLRGNETFTGVAEDLADDFSLIVRREDGTRETVNAGDVSVRGLFGYTE